MASVVRSMDSAMQTMNLEKISSIMDKFETQFENLDVQAQYMETGMGNTTTVSAPADQVQELMQKVAEMHGMEVTTQLREAGTSSLAAEAEEQDELSERLAKLRNQ